MIVLNRPADPHEPYRSAPRTRLSEVSAYQDFGTAVLSGRATGIEGRLKRQSRYVQLRRVRA